jgi:glycosyltransferase involved in cell wall biosynthesis
VSANLAARKALVLSPTASHPQDYGNRNRVLEMTSFFKRSGYEIHFLLYPMEPDWAHAFPKSAKDMSQAWDSFTIVPPSKVLHQPSVGTYHEIDEWWDPQIGHYLDWLFKRQSFDVFLVNYAFLSKALDSAPNGTIKILEQHDQFSGRKELFSAHGAPVEFFYTTPEQERIAFRRADIVVAIKEAEAEFLRTLTRSAVVSVPFYLQEGFRPQRPARLSVKSELRVGFIGARNMVNIINMQRFLKVFEKYQRIYVPNMSINIAGNVCSQLKSDTPHVNLLGRVEDLTEFYDGIDVVVVPLMFSTGIKIKVGEALSVGKPVVSTANGFDGYAATDEFHKLESLPDVCRALVRLAFDRERLRALEARTMVAAKLGRQANIEGYRALAKSVRRLSKAIVFVTDQPIWNAVTLRQERIAQWCQLCRHLRRTIVVYVGDQPVQNRTRGDLGSVGCIDLSGRGADTSSIIQVLTDIRRDYEIAELVLSVDGESGRSLWAHLREQFKHITLDTWTPAFADIAAAESQAPIGDIWLSHEAATSDRGRALSTSPIRYEPYYLSGWGGGPRSREILVALCDADHEEKSGVELVQTMINGHVPVTVLDFADMGPSLFELLKGRPVPSLMVTIGKNRHAASALATLAQQVGSEYLDLGANGFPFLAHDSSSTPHLCSTYADVAELLSSSMSIAAHAALHRSDAGWNIYWKIIASR